MFTSSVFVNKIPSIKSFDWNLTIVHVVKSRNSYVCRSSRRLWSSQAQSRWSCCPSINSRPADSCRVRWAVDWWFAGHRRSTASWGTVPERGNSKIGSTSSLPARCPRTSVCNDSNRYGSSNLLQIYIFKNNYEPERLSVFSFPLVVLFKNMNFGFYVAWNIVLPFLALLQIFITHSCLKIILDRKVEKLFKSTCLE